MAEARMRVGRAARLLLLAALAWALWTLPQAARAGSTPAPPVDSDLGATLFGGGCSPTALHPALLDMLELVNPEWAPVVNGTTVDSTPVLVHGTVIGMHGDLGGDFPATHLRADVNYFVQLDPQDAARLGTGNGDGLLHFEWEAGVYPAFAWAGPGDRVVGLGRWIFDCGHPDPVPGSCAANPAQACVLDSDCRPPTCPTCSAADVCQGVHFRYSTELHPPQATAVIRLGRGAVLQERRHARAVPATRVDIYASPAGGGAGDRCVLSAAPSVGAIFAKQCFPLSQPVAPINSRDFVFDVPLPPRPPGARGPHALIVRRILRDAPGGVPAPLRIEHVLDGPSPHLHVSVLLTGDPSDPGAPLPTGFAGTILAGWRHSRTRLTHVRVTLEDVVVRNPLQRVTPVAPKLCDGTGPSCTSDADCSAGSSCLGIGPVKAWHLQAAVNGEWKELSGLKSVSAGEVIPEHLVWDQYLPEGGAVHFRVDGSARECVTEMYGKSIGEDLVELGLGTGLACLNSTEHSVGTVDASFPAPSFGAGAGSAIHEEVSVGGEGGTCSVTTSQQCVVDADCPAAETCNTTGGAMLVRYRIQRLEGREHSTGTDRD